MPKFTEDEFKAKIVEIKRKLVAQGISIPTSYFHVFEYIDQHPEEKPQNITNFEAMLDLYKIWHRYD